MSTDRDLVTGYGVILDLGRFASKPVKVPSCDHPERIGQRFCPTCGKKVGESTTRPFGLDSEISEIFYELDLGMPDGYIVNKVEYEVNKWFIGFGEVADVNEAPLIEFHGVPTKEDLQSVLAGVLSIIKTNVADNEVPDDLFTSLKVGFYAAIHLH